MDQSDHPHRIYLPTVAPQIWYRQGYSSKNNPIFSSCAVLENIPPSFSSSLGNHYIFCRTTIFQKHFVISSPFGYEHSRKINLLSNHNILQNCTDPIRCFVKIEKKKIGVYEINLMCACERGMLPPPPLLAKYPRIFYVRYHE